MQGRMTELKDQLNAIDISRLEVSSEWENFLKHVSDKIDGIDKLTIILDFLSATPFLQLKFLQNLIAQGNLFACLKNMNDFLAVYYQFKDSFYADIFAGTRRFLSGTNELSQPDMDSCQLREWLMEHGVHAEEMLGLLPAAVKDMQTLAKVFNCIPARWMGFYYEKFHALISQGSNLAMLLDLLPLARCDRLLAIISFQDGYLPMPARANENALKAEKLILFKKYYGYPRATHSEQGLWATLASYVDQQLGSAWLGKTEELLEQNPEYKARDTYESKQIVTFLASLVSEDQETYLAKLGQRLPQLCLTDADYLAVRQQVIDPTLVIKYFLMNVHSVAELVCGLKFLSSHHSPSKAKDWYHGLDDRLIEQSIQTSIQSTADLEYALTHAVSWRDKILTTLGQRLFTLLDSPASYAKAAQNDHLFLKILLEKHITTPEDLAFLYNHCPSVKLYQTVVGNQTCVKYFAYERFIANESNLSCFLLGLVKPQREKFVTAMRELLATWYDSDAFLRVCSVFEPAEQIELMQLFNAQEVQYRLGLFAHNHESADEAVVRYYSAP